jgi:tetratricopeptide (TPR) repeat protein
MHFESLQGGTVTIGEHNCVPPGAVVRTESRELTGKVALQRIQRDSRGAAGIVRGAPDRESRSAVTPSWQAVVVSDRPFLTWPVQGKDALYKITIEVAGSNRLAFRTTTSNHSLQIPESNALKRGRKYLLSISSSTDGRRTQFISSEFMVATSTEADELKQLESIAAGSDVSALLLVATTYEAYGAVDQALQVYERLRQLSPSDPYVCAACATIYERAGRLSDAERMWEAAKKLGWTMSEDTERPAR